MVLEGGGGGSNSSSSTSGEGAGGGSIGEFSFGAATSSSPATQRFAATVRLPLAQPSIACDDLVSQSVISELVVAA